MMRCFALVLFFAVSASAAPLPSPSPNPQIAGVVKEISAQNIEASIRKLVGFGTRHTLSETKSETRGIGAARRWLKSEFDRYSKDSDGRLKVTMEAFNQPPDERNPNLTEVVNVVATLPGEQPESRDRYYVVSGHYDSRVTDPMNADADAPGANDDASGVAAVLELARVMSKQKWDATLVFMAVAGEEQGLYGSTQWARSAKQKKWNIAGMITNDIIGSSHAEDGHVDDKHVRLFAEGVPPWLQMPEPLLRQIKTGGENDSATRELARFMKTTGELYVPGMTVAIVYRKDRYLRGGDHSPFLEAGYPAVRMTEPNEDFRHQHQDVRKEGDVQYGDLPEFVDFAYVAQVARINAASLGALALAPAVPTGVEIETKKLTNDTTLTWQPNKEPDLARYEVLWRETTAPLWQEGIKAGSGTEFTVPKVSKDNYIFGLAAVDKDGNRSPAVYPAPSAK
ncbi:MAG: M20/M25/M40 family metallo-hydrolase [Chthoniobacterales bacterium]